MQDYKLIKSVKEEILASTLLAKHQMMDEGAKAINRLIKEGEEWLLENGYTPGDVQSGKLVKRNMVVPIKDGQQTYFRLVWQAWERVDA